MSRLKVLVYGLNFSPEPTGIGKYTGELIEALCAAGHVVRVITAPPYYPQWKVRKPYRASRYQKYRASENLITYRCPIWVPVKPTGLTRLVHLVSFAISSFPVLIWMRLWRPQAILVVVPTLFCIPGALLAMAGSRAKRIVHVQDLELDAAFDLGLIRNRVLRSLALRAERWLLNRFDVVSSISMRMLERLAAKGVAENKLMLLPNWIGVESVSPGVTVSTFRFEWGIAPDRVVVLYAGSLGEKQGMEAVLEAAARLQGESAIVFVVCSGGPTYRRLKDGYPQLSNVIWRELVPAERLNDLLNLADIHVLPQRADAADLVMPSKLTGMLASGRPVVATAVAGTEVAEVVEGRGIVVPPGDVDALTDAIRTLASDRAQRESLGTAGRAYAVEHLDRSRILSKFEQELRGLVNGEGGTRDSGLRTRG